jgi:hypothetical protein
MLNSDPGPHCNQYIHHNYDYLHLRLELGEVGVELPDVLVHQLVGLDGDLHLVVRDLLRLLEHFLRKRRGGKINFEFRIRGRKKIIFNRSFNLSSDLTMQRTNTENSKHIFPEMELRGLSPNFHVHVSVSDFHDQSAYSAAGNVWTDPGNKQITHRNMNVEIGTEAAQFPEKEHLNGIFVEVHQE